jgi:hypothetical protein
MSTCAAQQKPSSRSTELSGRSTDEWHTRNVAPHLLVAAWVAFLAISLWQHALASVQPPWGDGLSYLWKAASFWNAVGQGRMFNPLDLFPSVRPPGTILMSYPFGMDAGYHGYHFRSVFVPLACTVLAVYVAAGAGNAKRHPWQVAGYALLLSSLPMFYWLDWNDARWINNGWGMVDNFQAGIAALAGAAIVRSVATRSQRWLLLSACLAAFTFLVKQSGLMLMGVVGLVWLVAVAFQWRIALRSGMPPLRPYLVHGMTRFAIVYLAVAGAGLASSYFSRSNFAYAMKALGFYRDVAPDISVGLFHFASGEAAVVWMVVVGALFVYRVPALLREDRLSAATTLGFALGAPLAWILGLWYWIVIQAGGNQVRYFYPFMLLGAIFAVPAIVSASSRAGAWVRGTLVAVCVAAAANIALLLIADSPSDRWQKATGVSVSVGHDREEVENATQLLAQVRRTGRDAKVYFTPNSAPPQTYLFVGAYEKVVHPKLPAFEPTSPMDWTRGFVVRTAELADSDYIVTRKFADRPAPSRFAAKAFATFGAESDAFDGWLSTLDERAGVTTYWDGRMLRVLRVADRGKFEAAIRDFVAQHEWRPEFVAANRSAPAPWTDATGVAAEFGSLPAGPFAFEDVYVVHAIRPHAIDNGVKVDLWWEEVRHHAANQRRYLFLHLIDAEGNILHGQQVALFPYDPPSEGRRWRHAAAMFHDVLPNAAIRALAFGIYEPERKDGGLMSSSGNARVDWGGKRNIVEIAADHSPAPSPANSRPP